MTFPSRETEQGWGAPPTTIVVLHTIDWEGVKFPSRETDWIARGVKEVVEIRKTGAHPINRDGWHHQLLSFYSKLW